MITFYSIIILLFGLVCFVFYIGIGLFFLNEKDLLTPKTKYEAMLYAIKLFYWPLFIVYTLVIKFLKYWKDLPDE